MTSLIARQRAAIHHFSVAMETAAKKRRAAPTVSAMQRTDAAPRLRPVISCLTGVKTERDAHVLQNGSVSPVPEYHVRTTRKEQENFRPCYHPISGNKPRDRRNFGTDACVIFFLRCAYAFRRRQKKFLDLRLLRCSAACRPKRRRSVGCSAGRMASCFVG